MWTTLIRAGATLAATAGLYGCTVIDIDIYSGGDVDDPPWSPGDTTAYDPTTGDPVTSAPPDESETCPPHTGDTEGPIWETSTTTAYPGEGDSTIGTSVATSLNPDPEPGQTSSSSTTFPDEGNTFVVDPDTGQTSSSSTTFPDEGNTFVVDPDTGQTSSSSTTSPDEGNTFVVDG